ncbi:unnamed protein product [Clonostachys chloroleuca]|uniref:Uncharacterized protein n=1 Tax=Clonostachys chloroleuca TaxID=1926264 RepID=A0AA35MEZ3_9HYPO|nr:unnamed protein product [Clonostachys chloroleuca]
MDIGIFIDALDEYVNRPEFIVSFLQDLIQSSPQSWTRMRVFFSSRPWAIFKQNFSACPGFQIHEYTEVDIFDFCNANIPLNPTSNSLLEPLSSRRISMGNSGNARSRERHPRKRIQHGRASGKVQKALDSLPDELDQYYVTIIESRTSAGKEAISLNDIVHIIDCSRAHNLEEARIRTRESSQSTQWYVQEYGKEGYIRMLSGGLIHIAYHDGNSQVQFMHQTIKEFVEDPQFKALILKKTARLFCQRKWSLFLGIILANPASVTHKRLRLPQD